MKIRYLFILLASLTRVIRGIGSLTHMMTRIAGQQLDTDIISRDRRDEMAMTRAKSARVRRSFPARR